MRARKNRLGTFGAGGFWWWNQHFRIDFYKFLICFMAAKCFLCQERQRLEAMPELMILLILQWHVERHVTKLRLGGEMRLLLLEKFEHLKMIDGFRVFIRFYLRAAAPAADPGRIGKEAKQIGIKTLRCFAPWGFRPFSYVYCCEIYLIGLNFHL